VSRVHISERWKHPSLRTIVVGEEAIGYTSHEVSAVKIV
jgi:hypothetical protein